MDKYIKRIQSKLTYRGQTATKQQCRDAYQAIVANLNAPTDAEIDLVVAQLAKPIQAEVADSVKLVPAISGVELEKPVVVPPPVAEATPSVNEALHSPKEEVQPLRQETVGQLTVADNQPLAAPAGITQQQIQTAVAQQFADRPNDIKAQVVQYASQLAFSSAKEMEQMLQQLRETELSVMMQIISTHNTDRSQTLKAFQDALGQAEQSRKEQSSDFFAQFSQQMAQMKDSFGVL